MKLFLTKKDNQNETHPIRPMERAKTKSPLRQPIHTISSTSCLVNIPLPARRSKKSDPIAPSTFKTRLFALVRVQFSTSTAYSMYFTDGKCVRANFCSSSTLLSLLSLFLILIYRTKPKFIDLQRNNTNKKKEVNEHTSIHTTCALFQEHGCPSSSYFQQIHKV